MYYLLLIVASVIEAVNFSFNKIYQVRVKDTIPSALLKSFAISVITGILFLCISGFNFSCTGFTFLMAFILSFITVVSDCVCFFGYTCGSIALFTLFQMSGGMLLPFIYGIIIGNKVTVFSVIGILLMLTALALPLFESRDNMKGMSPKFIALCISIFLINGSISIFSYIHSNSEKASTSMDMLIVKSMISAVMAALFIAVLYIIKRKKSGSNKIKLPAKKQFAFLILLLVVISSAGNISYLLQLTGASHLPAVATYPIITGGIIVFTSLAGVIIFKEKLSKLSIAGIVLTFISTFLFVL